MRPLSYWTATTKVLVDKTTRRGGHCEERGPTSQLQQAIRLIVRHASKRVYSVAVRGKDRRAGNLYKPM